ncbi:Quinidine resistance protein 2 [Cytospora mali]|uniref:Quinidine resistance protein 2 n=1 Tax=Cytospora mali TaxID=578113 RepID=A0A194UNE4_CYTMA|nr:Quinidine resistance protein 2 [Valsa mali var. pyri (nom. inval.)]
MSDTNLKGEQSPDQPVPPFTVFSPARKKAIALQTAFSATFSGLSSFIYYPAIRPLAEDLDVSVATINLTVSAYLIVAGIFPSIIGDISDQSGRRVASLLAFTLYFSANLGIALQDSYAALVVLRCLQSAGSSGTIAISYGVIADITTPAERGSYVGIVLEFTNAAPCLGPVIGGIIVQELSWRWIFWLLVMLSGLHLLGLVMFFPETSRKLVGNGSLRPRSRLNRTLWSFRRAPKDQENLKESLGEVTGRMHLPNPFVCLRLLLNRPTFIIISVGSIQYAIFSALGTSLATQMATVYSLDYFEAGLIYLPAGIGGLLAAVSTGKLLDRDYRVISRGLSRGPPSSEGLRLHAPNDLLSFPIEKARLRSIFPFLCIASTATIGYGWALHTQIHIAVPLVLQFLTGATQVAMFVMCGTLLTDFNPDRSANAQSSYNLVRCALAAGLVTALEPIAHKIGTGWYFTVYGMIGLFCAPLLVVLRIWGWQWRRARAERSEVTS